MYSILLLLKSNASIFKLLDIYSLVLSLPKFLIISVFIGLLKILSVNKDGWTLRFIGIINLINKAAHNIYEYIFGNLDNIYLPINITKNKITPSLVILKTELNIVDKIFIDSPPYP